MQDNRLYPVNLKVDCKNLTEATIAGLAEKIYQYADVQIVDDDLIFVSGEVTKNSYDKIWDILDRYNVTVD